VESGYLGRNLEQSARFKDKVVLGWAPIPGERPTQVTRKGKGCQKFEETYGGGVDVGEGYQKRNIIP